MTTPHDSDDYDLETSQSAKRLAGQRVVAIGYLEHSTGDLQLLTVRTVAR